MRIPTTVVSHRYVCMFGDHSQDNRSFMIAAAVVAILLACCQCHEPNKLLKKTRTKTYLFCYLKNSYPSSSKASV